MIPFANFLRVRPGEHFDDVVKKRWDKLAHALHVSAEEAAAEQDLASAERTVARVAPSSTSHRARRAWARPACTSTTR